MRRRMIRKPLPHPVTPPLPHGLQRGGVFESPSTPLTFIDVAQRTIPTSSPLAYEVPQNVLRAPVASVPTTDIRPISGFGQYRMSADMPPLPVRPATPVQVPKGATEGGIFGPGQVYAYPITPGVRKVRTLSIRRPYGASPDGIGQVARGGRPARGSQAYMLGQPIAACDSASACDQAACIAHGAIAGSMQEVQLGYSMNPNSYYNVTYLPCKQRELAAQQAARTGVRGIGAFWRGQPTAECDSASVCDQVACRAQGAMVPSYQWVQLGSAMNPNSYYNVTYLPCKQRELAAKQAARTGVRGIGGCSCGGMGGCGC
jgi:hypothetical protein